MSKRSALSVIATIIEKRVLNFIYYLRFMRFSAIILFIILPYLGLTQQKNELKGKFYGNYKGVVSSYEIDTGSELLKVSESAIYITIAKDEISVTVGKNKMYGKYIVMFEAEDYYLLDAIINGQAATERIMVYKRGRKIARDGMYPQPVTELKKYR